MEKETLGQNHEIRLLSINDFENMYSIWSEGIQNAFLNSTLELKENQDFYREFYRNSILNQTENFKIWGYFIDQILVGWQSLLPCQSAPLVYHLFAESSTYISNNFRKNGIGKKLLIHAIAYAKEYSTLGYILGYVSEGNKQVETMITEVGFEKVGTLPKSMKDNIVNPSGLMSIYTSITL